MILDIRSTDVSAGVTADVAIVGAGPAGLALAAALGSAAGRTLVLESGGSVPGPDPDLARGTVDRPYYDLPETRMRGLGGGSGCWSGWCDRLGPADFTHRPWIPLSGWCLGYAELSSYYADAEEFCGIRPGFTAGERIWRPGGQKAPLGGLFDQTPYVAVGRRNLGLAHRSVFEQVGVDLLLHATVTRIETSRDGQQVDRLVLRDAGGAEFRVEAGTVVLATGGLENARLLLVSTSGGWTDGIGNGSGFVGRCFMEHPHVDALRVRARPGADLDIAYFRESAVPGTSMLVGGALALTDEICAGQRIARAQAFVEPAGMHLDGRPTIRRDGRRFLPRYAVPAADEFAVVIVSEQVPNRESRVTLSDQRDGYGVPLPRIRWDLNHLDHRTVAVAADSAREVLGRAGVPAARSRLPRGRWPLDTLGGPHHLGTTRMAATEDDGVVNADCRVHGVANLFVLGGSVFPTAGYAPPTLTIVALALRLADHLRKR